MGPKEQGLLCISGHWLVTDLEWKSEKMVFQIYNPVTSAFSPSPFHMLKGAHLFQCSSEPALNFLFCGQKHHCSFYLNLFQSLPGPCLKISPFIPGPTPQFCSHYLPRNQQFIPTPVTFSACYQVSASFILLHPENAHRISSLPSAASFKPSSCVSLVSFNSPLRHHLAK